MSATPQTFTSGSVTSTGVICSLGVEGSKLPTGVLVGGTFVGTAKVEVSDNPEAGSPTWTQYGADLTAPGTVEISIPVKAVRVRCSAYTSGTVEAYIGTPVP